MQANLGRLTRLQEIIRTNSEAITRMETERHTWKPDQQSGEPDPGGGEFPRRHGVGCLDWIGRIVRSRIAVLSELASRKKKLEDLATKYTSLHPSVVQARTQVEQLEAKIAELRKAARQAEGRTSGGSAKPSSRLPFQAR